MNSRSCSAPRSPADDKTLRARPDNGERCRQSREPGWQGERGVARVAGGESAPSERVSGTLGKQRGQKELLLGSLAPGRGFVIEVLALSEAVRTGQCTRRLVGIPTEAGG